MGINSPIKHSPLQGPATLQDSPVLRSLLHFCSCHSLPRCPFSNLASLSKSCPAFSLLLLTFRTYISTPPISAPLYSLLYCLLIVVHTLENLFLGQAVTAVTFLFRFARTTLAKGFYFLLSTLLAIKGV